MFWTKKKEEAFRKKIVEEMMAAEAERQEVAKAEAEKLAEAAAKEPRVEIKSAGVDPVKGIQIELDWNDAFIAHLREHGFSGLSEEEIIQKYLARLYSSVLSDFGPGEQDFE